MAVSVQRLRTWLGSRQAYQSLGLGTMVSGWMNRPKTGVVVVQPDCSIFALACKAPRRPLRAFAETHLTQGLQHKR